MTNFYIHLTYFSPFVFAGIYVRQCVLEYKKLTFSQLMRFHMSLLNYFQQESDGTYKEMQSDANKVSAEHYTLTS